jgi:hypothetical protein
MLNLYNLHIEELFLHQVGNKSKNEPLFLSDVAQALNDESNALLKQYFSKPFMQKEENYFHFEHETDLDFHPLFSAISGVFDNPHTLLDTSKTIAKHLFSSSENQHIKSGELFVAYFTNVVLDNEKVDAIGIFKSEIKNHFLKFDTKGNQFQMLLDEGVDLNKLDKGALIFNSEKEAGYRILSVDSNRYDAKYWLEEFLAIAPFEDAIFQTKKYLKFCQNFAKDVVLPAEDKKEEVLFMNRSMNFFAKNDEFQESSFIEEVIENPDLIPEFRHYKETQAPKYKIEDLTEFPIANNAVTAARKKTKNIIALDTNVQLKLDFINPESADKFLEKGWDEERQMYYYLVYFNKEIKA